MLIEITMFPLEITYPKMIGKMYIKEKIGSVAKFSKLGEALKKQTMSVAL